VIDAATDMVRTAVIAMLAVGVPAVALAGWLVGAKGAWTAAGAVLLVMGGFALNGLALRWAARQSPAIVQAVMLGGLLARLVLYGLLAVTLAPTELVDAPTLAVVVPVALAVLLALEVRVARKPEFRMIDPAPLVPDAKDHS
jgi:hypothetical protein